MTNNSGAQFTKQPSRSKPALERLNKLAGEWKGEISFPSDPSTVIGTHATFEWMEETGVLVQRSEAAHPDFPKGFSIIGCDDELESYSMLYYDSRDIARIYQMSLSDDVWTLWRDAPSFSQRYTGRFSDDGNTLTGAWEMLSDGSTWEIDFNLTYTRVGSGAAKG